MIIIIVMTDSRAASFLINHPYKNCLFSKLKCLYAFLMWNAAMLSLESVNMVTSRTRQRHGTSIWGENKKKEKRTK